MNTKDIGENSEAQVMSAFIKMGYTVLTPVLGDNKRYDLVIEVNGDFHRVQVKTARKLKNGSISFDTCSSSIHRRGGKKRDYRGQIELFAAYSPDTGKIYIIPVEDVGKTAVQFRIDPPGNNQKKDIKWAKDYELDKTSLLRYIGD